MHKTVELVIIYIIYYLLFYKSSSTPKSKSVFYIYSFVVLFKNKSDNYNSFLSLYTLNNSKNCYIVTLNIYTIENRVVANLSILYNKIVLYNF